MEKITAKSGREYSLLPIDNERGLPQSFPLLFGGRTYYFRLYANVAADLLDEEPIFLKLTDSRAFLVVRVQREDADGNRQALFLRKVVPDLEYEAEDIMLYFESQHIGVENLNIAAKNLNGQGDLGSQVVGGIASRWV
jgi:hypothetical protein